MSGNFSVGAHPGRAMNTQEQQAAPPAAPLRAQPGNLPAKFDILAIRGRPLFYAVIKSAVINWALDYPQREYLMGFFRRFFPICRIGWVLVFRDEDVREVLAHNCEFPVPWGDRMMQVTGSRNFVLGMEDGPEYQRNYQQLAKAFPREDVAKYVVPLAARVSADILSGRTSIDAVQDLIWRVPSQLCEDYYGIEIPDKLLFAQWTVAMSSYLFGTPSKSTDTSGRGLAMVAADCFRSLIRGAIQKARQGTSPGVVLPRLIDMQRSDPKLTDDVLEAHLFGMVTGFVPTDLLSGGRVLDTLLRNAVFLEAARSAALAGDDDRLWRCLREALRFRLFNPGPFRLCGPNGYRLADGTSRARHLAPDTPVLAVTQSAMFDSRRVARPRSFDPDRAPEDYLVFGYGQHWCLGSFIAIAQLTQTFKALLRKRGLRRAPGKAGRLGTIGAYPAHLVVEFDE
jgi:cytochrome P450